MPANIRNYLVPIASREVVLVGDDNISAVLRRDSALAYGFTFKENPGCSVSRLHMQLRHLQLLHLQVGSKAAIVYLQELKVLKHDGCVETGLGAWRYVLRKFGIQRCDDELDMMLLDYWKLE